MFGLGEYIVMMNSDIFDILFVKKYFGSAAKV